MSGVCSDKSISNNDSFCGSYLKRFLAHSESPITISEPDDTANDETITVHLDFSGDHLVDSKSHIPILEASLNASIPHTHVCGGQARCSTCRVLILKGLEHVKPRNEKEKRLAAIKGFPQNVRLACQTKITGDIKLRRLVFDDQDINEAVNQGAQSLGEQGQEQHLSILFSDIRSFTSFSEKNLPYDIIHILNRYFEALGHCIDENGGYIDKYM
ncbi:MAG TPA: adenylate/guanylate cyclase domain-containing protein, partial [Spirochaetes bacterium]|nr:adenylate/guanylate cyclase domain-containing protein [Spirochaetota bacterium]